MRFRRLVEWSPRVPRMEQQIRPTDATYLTATYVMQVQAAANQICANEQSHIDRTFRTCILKAKPLCRQPDRHPRNRGIHHPKLAVESPTISSPDRTSKDQLQEHPKCDFEGYRDTSTINCHTCYVCTSCWKSNLCTWARSHWQHVSHFYYES